MMIDKRLLGTVPESKSYIIKNVLCQWICLCSNIVLMGTVATLLSAVYKKEAGEKLFLTCLSVAVFALLLRFLCTLLSARFSFLSSKSVKETLRTKIYEKLLRLGAGYTAHAHSAELVQVAVEGVDQLETYFGAYLPQFFYAMLAPLTLFAVTCFVSVKAAAVLFICVPLIPVSIALVQTWAKKLLGKYWGQYTALGDTFLENLQGLTTLKIYQADEYKQQKMNEESEKFRKITMKVLTMQLNSITIMDFIAYGGAALGIIVAIWQYGAGDLALRGCLFVLLLAADFFLPMRQLGSFFHIAMNGMAASDKIFKLLETAEGENVQEGVREIACGTDERDREMTGESAKEASKDPRWADLKMPGETADICLCNVSFSYDGVRPILEDINLTLASGKFSAIVGESGSGKSTVAGLLMGRNKGYRGEITIGGVPLAQIPEESLMRHITYVGHNSYLFKGSVRENLLLAKPDATDAALWQVLKRAKLDGFLEEAKGLDTLLLEQGSNLSGGQRQRLTFARALLHDTPVYIFDETTSNIDVESEADLLAEILQLAKEKTVLFISHRLRNVEQADCIYVLEAGRVKEQGTKEMLLAAGDSFALLYETQRSLETFGWQQASCEEASENSGYDRDVICENAGSDTREGGL